MSAAGGPDEAPRPRQMTLPPWQGLMAHTRAGDEVIYVLGGMVLGPAEPVDMRCSGCRAEAEVSLWHEQETLIFIVAHRPACRAVESIVAGAR